MSIALLMHHPHYTEWAKEHCVHKLSLNIRLPSILSKDCISLTSVVVIYPLALTVMWSTLWSKHVSHPMPGNVIFRWTKSKQLRMTPLSPGQNKYTFIKIITARRLKFDLKAGHVECYCMYMYGQGEIWSLNWNLYYHWTQTANMRLFSCIPGGTAYLRWTLIGISNLVNVDFSTCY